MRRGAATTLFVPRGPPSAGHGYLIPKYLRKSAASAVKFFSLFISDNSPVPTIL